MSRARPPKSPINIHHGREDLTVVFDLPDELGCRSRFLTSTAFSSIENSFRGIGNFRRSAEDGAFQSEQWKRSGSIPKGKKFKFTARQSCHEVNAGEEGDGEIRFEYETFYSGDKEPFTAIKITL